MRVRASAQGGGMVHGELYRKAPLKGPFFTPMVHERVAKFKIGK